MTRPTPRPTAKRSSSADPLLRYREKRAVDTTPEPKGKAKASGKELSYCVQKHDASRLHYDFRLEVDGALKSWALPKGPSVDPSQKRLAVRVEDHPIDYGEFEGTIPKGEYGGGTVLLWDRGRWQPEGDPRQGLEEGALTFTLDGDKLHGRWTLRRLGRRNQKAENWFLMKGKDDFASDEDILEERPKSTKSGRDLTEIASNKKARTKPKMSKKQNKTRAPVEETKMPSAPGFLLPTLVDEAPDGTDWIHGRHDRRCRIPEGRGGTGLGRTQLGTASRRGHESEPTPITEGKVSK